MPEAKKQSWTSKRLDAISARLESMSNGDRAALRRMSPEDPGRATGVLIATLYQSGVPKKYLDYPETLHRWAHIVRVMAILSGARGRGVHADRYSDEDQVTPGRDFGQALRDAGWSELRMMRLVSARGSALTAQLGPMARFLAGKGQLPLDFAPLAKLVLNDGGKYSEHAETARLKLATGYFASPAKSDTEEEDAA